MNALRIVSASELKERKIFKFKFVRDGKKRDGFLTRFDSEILAYENQCQHIAVNLDYEGGRIFSADGQHFICHSHGALYDPTSGLCVRGPCEGERLKKLAIEIRGEWIYLGKAS